MSNVSAFTYTLPFHTWPLWPASFLTPNTVKSSPKYLQRLLKYCLILSFSVARELSQCLYRHTAVSHMAAVARSFLHTRDVSTKLPDDWATLDIDVIIKEVSRDLDLPSDARDDLNHCKEFRFYFSLLNSDIHVRVATPEIC